MNNYTLNDMVTLSWEMLKKEWQKNGPTSSFLVEFSNDVKNRSQLQSHSVYFIAGTALLFTIHRYIYTAIVLKVICFIYTMYAFRKCSCRKVIQKILKSSGVVKVSVLCLF